MPNRVDAFLELVVKQNGSDLHLISGNPPRMRLFGNIVPIKYRELTADETRGFLYEILSDELKKMFELLHGVDFAYECEGLARFRVNIFRHLGGVGAVFRVIPHVIPSLDDLDMPPVLQSFCQNKRGLVLVTGPTGSGKSTTLAAMIDSINKNTKGHILTVEDPVEFLHPRKGCLISQREVGVHAESFASALRSALREDPNVLLVGELRDYESISLAVTAAETGILVFGTLHTNSAAASVDRMINVFSAPEQPRIRAMLSTSLVGVVSQQLLRRSDGKGRVAAVEIMVNSSAAANIIREGKSQQLQTVIQSGALQGMQSMDRSLRKLLDEQLIDGSDAYLTAVNKEEFEEYRLDDELEML